MNIITPNTHTSQAPITEKPKRKPFSREIQKNYTAEDRKRIWGNRRRISTKIQQQRKQTKSPYLSDRKLVAFLNLSLGHLERKETTSKEYIYTHTYEEIAVASDSQSERAVSGYAALHPAALAKKAKSKASKVIELAYPKELTELWSERNQQAFLADYDGQYQPKKGSFMKQIAIPAEILAIKSYKPTLAGQVDLAIFAPGAIVEADATMLKRSKPNDPHRYFIGLARQFTKELHLPLNFALKNQLAAQHEITEDLPRFDSLFVAKQQQQNSQKREGSAQSSIPLPSDMQDRLNRTTARKEQERLAYEAKRAEQLAWDEANPYLAAKKIEQALHDPVIYTGAKQIWPPQQYNAWFAKLDPVEQRQLLGEVHSNCQCEKYFLSQPKPIAATINDNIPPKEIGHQYTIDDWQPNETDAITDAIDWGEILA